MKLFKIQYVIVKSYFDRCFLTEVNLSIFIGYLLKRLYTRFENKVCVEIFHLSVICLRKSDRSTRKKN